MARAWYLVNPWAYLGGAGAQLPGISDCRRAALDGPGAAASACPDRSRRIALRPPVASCLHRFDTTLTSCRAELADFAMRYNGTENMWYFCGSWNPCTQLATGLVRLILAAYTQTRGNTQGWLVDPETLQPFFDSPAMREVLDILHRLYLASPPDGSQSGPCLPGSVLFQQSKCLVAVDVPSTFKASGREAPPCARGMGRGVRSLGWARSARAYPTVLHRSSCGCAHLAPRWYLRAGRQPHVPGGEHGAAPGLTRVCTAARLRPGAGPRDQQPRGVHDEALPPRHAVSAPSTARQRSILCMET